MLLKHQSVNPLCCDDYETALSLWEPVLLLESALLISHLVITQEMRTPFISHRYHRTAHQLVRTG